MRYDEIINNPELKYDEIQSIVATPSKYDYINGYVYRYFVSEIINNSSIFEVSASTYSQFATNPLYKCIKLKWRIVGTIDEIIDSNKRSISFVYSDMPKLKNYLLNLTQFMQK